MNPDVFIRQRLGALTRALPGARQGDVPSVHRARVATRRLRAALPLIATGQSGRKIARAIRRLTQALGPVRELDVALLTLDELEAAGAASRAALACLRKSIGEERRGLMAEMVRGIDRVDLEKLRRRTEDARPASSRGQESHQRRVADARQRAARRAEALRATIDNAAGIYLPDRLHDVRIAVKKLRYALELVRELSRSRATARILALKRAQELLGRMHDHEILIARIRGVQGSSSAPRLRVSADLDLVVRRLENECRQLHGHYMTSRGTLLEIIDAATAAPRRRIPAA